MQMISNTGSGRRVSHQCELLGIHVSRQTWKLVCTLGATVRFLTVVNSLVPESSNYYMLWNVFVLLKKATEKLKREIEN
jgi:hypothetical protein